MPKIIKKSVVIYKPRAVGKSCISKPASVEIHCPDCGRGKLSVFRSGIIPRFVICGGGIGGNGCGKKIATNGNSKQTAKCEGCNRPFVTANAKHCTYCGRPNDGHEHLNKIKL